MEQTATRFWWMYLLPLKDTWNNTSFFLTLAMNTLMSQQPKHTPELAFSLWRATQSGRKKNVRAPLATGGKASASAGEQIRTWDRMGTKLKEKHRHAHWTLMRDKQHAHTDTHTWACGSERAQTKGGRTHRKKGRWVSVILGDALPKYDTPPLSFICVYWLHLEEAGIWYWHWYAVRFLFRCWEIYTQPPSHKKIKKTK